MSYLSLVAGARDAVCLGVIAAAPQMAVVIRTLDALLLRLERQPQALQTDRGACFIGSDGGSSLAVPGRLTLWLWGHGIEHRFIPAGKPQRNGAVERLNGAIERSWQGEPDGLTALVEVWNWGKDGQPARERAYAGRAGWRIARMWERLARVRVTRKVDRQGKLSLWDRPVRVGRRWRDRSVVVSFDAERRLVVLHDERGALLTERELPWLTAAWVWADGDDLPPAGTGAAQAGEQVSSSTFG